MNLTASHSFEIECDLSGTFVRGYPATGPTYSCGGEPGTADQVEDVDVTGVYGLLRVTNDRDSRWERVDLLSGVDRSSPAYAQIVANLLAFIGDDADAALIGAASE